MSTEIYSTNRVKVERDEGLNGLDVLRVKCRKDGPSLTLLVSHDSVVMIASHDSHMEVVVHNGSPAISVSK